MERAKVKWWNDTKGFGFLTLDNGKDVFVHYSKIDMRGRRFLIEGGMADVEFEQGEKGLLASRVIPVEPE